MRSWKCIYVSVGSVKKAKKTFATVKSHSWKRKWIALESSILIIFLLCCKSAPLAFLGGHRGWQCLENTGFSRASVSCCSPSWYIKEGNWFSWDITFTISSNTTALLTGNKTKMSSVSPQRVAGGEQLRQGQDNSFSQVLDYPGFALCSWEMFHPWLLQRVIGLCKVTHQDKKE